jgi:hypothetical protein
MRYRKFFHIIDLLEKTGYSILFTSILLSKFIDFFISVKVVCCIFLYLILQIECYSPKTIYREKWWTRRYIAAGQMIQVYFFGFGFGFFAIAATNFESCNTVGLALLLFIWLPLLWVYAFRKIVTIKEEGDVLSFFYRKRLKRLTKHVIIISCFTILSVVLSCM